MFGAGGLFGLHSLNAGVGVSTVIATVTGLVGASVAFVAFKVLRQAESTDSFSLEDMVGSTGRVSVGIPANRFGTVLISFAGATHNMTATADSEIPAGRMVKVVSVAGGNLVVAVAPTPSVTNEGARSDA
jgi:membrane-bound ClpP family serine protease